MKNISDLIEHFLLDAIGEDDSLAISRNELAQHFHCAPSQINYVLSTRFTLEKGFLLESRRGGGGYISIMRLDAADDYINELVTNQIGDSLEFARMLHILDRLVYEQLISTREYQIVKTMLNDKSMTACGQLNKNMLRASMLKAFLLSLMKLENSGENSV